MNYYKLLCYRAELEGKKNFCVLDGEQFSFFRMLRSVEKICANVLLSPGELVLIYSGKILFQLTAFFAVQALGGTPVLCHPSMPPAVSRQLIKENHIVWMLTESGWEKTGQGAVCLSGERIGVLSSGSDGIPKVMFRTYESWAGYFPIQNRIFEITSETKLFFSGSLSFTGNLNLVLSVLYAGGRIVGISDLSPRRWSDLLKSEQITHLYLVPAKLRLLCRTIRSETFALRMILSGSQLIDRETIEKLEHFFPDSKMLFYYGASELNYVTYLNAQELLRFPRSVGRPFPEIQVQICNGLIYVDTPYRVCGISSPYTVGDRGFWNEEGYLIFEGRSGRTENRDGIQVSLSKIEEYFKLKCNVADIVAVSYLDCHRRNRIGIFAAGVSQQKLEQVLISAKQFLMPQEIPQKAVSISHIPLNDSGKPDLLFLKMKLQEGTK